MTEHATLVMSLVRIHKPARVAATMTATVQAHREVTVGQVIDYGLSCLGEARGRLFGFGVEGHARAAEETVLPPGTYTVYAFRD